MRLRQEPAGLRSPSQHPSTPGWCRSCVDQDDARQEEVEKENEDRRVDDGLRCRAPDSLRAAVRSKTAMASDERDDGSENERLQQSSENIDELESVKCRAEVLVMADTEHQGRDHEPPQKPDGVSGYNENWHHHGCCDDSGDDKLL